MRKLIIPSLISICTFIYFYCQSCPTFYFWDSAELTAAVLAGGVPHPPGFPSLLILAKIWNSTLPFENAHGLNLLSSFFASLGLAFWFAAVVLMLRRLFPEKNNTEIGILSFISVLILGSSFSFGIQAVRFEVYSLNFACFAILLFMTLRFSFEDCRTAIFAPVMVIVTALSLGGHHFTIALTFPGLLLLLYYHRKLRLRLTLLMGAAVFIAIIPLYISIYVLSLKNPPLNWGDPSTFRNFVDYFFLREFDTPLSSMAPRHLAHNLAFVSGLVSGQLGLLGSILALWGIVKFSRIAPKLAVPVLLILIPNVFSILYFADYFLANYDLHGYLLFSLAALSLFMILIIGYLVDRIAELLDRRKPILRKFGRLPVLVLIAALILYFPVKRNLYSADLSKIAAAEDYAGLFLDHAPANSIVVTSYYNTYFCALAFRAARLSEDGILINNVYNWEHEWGRLKTAKILDFETHEISSGAEFYRMVLNRTRDRRPIYVEFDEASFPIANYLRPAGMGYLFSLSDTASIDPYAQIMEIDRFSKIAAKYSDIEWLRAWVLWFHNRGMFFEKRGEAVMASRYFDAAERIAAEHQ